MSVMALFRDVLHDHVDVDASLGQRPEDRGGDARSVFDLDQRQLGFVTRIGDAGDGFAFHDVLLGTHQCARIFIVVLETRQHAQPHANSASPVRPTGSAGPWRPSEASSSISSKAILSSLRALRVMRGSVV